jgi:hypothetical protein
MLMKLELWSTNIHVHDNFLTDESVISELKANAEIRDYFVTTEEKNAMNPALKVLVEQATMAVMNYCLEVGIEYEDLKFNNIQRNYMRTYDQNTVNTYLYEPHDDIAEGGFITCLYYIDSDVTDNGPWVGGELCIHNHLTFAYYHKNAINIRPKPNRLVIFPGYKVHRVKPYFGKKPRAAVTMGWTVERIPKEEPIVI